MKKFYMIINKSQHNRNYMLQSLGELWGIEYIPNNPMPIKKYQKPFFN